MISEHGREAAKALSHVSVGEDGPLQAAIRGMVVGTATGDDGDWEAHLIAVCPRFEGLGLDQLLTRP